MNTGNNLLLFILCALCLLLLLLVLILLLRQTSRRKAEEDFRLQEDLLSEFEDRIAERTQRQISGIRQDINMRLSYDSEENRKTRQELADAIGRSNELQRRRMDESYDKLHRILNASIRQLQQTSQEKLDSIQSDISHRLDISLNERLDTSFRSVGEQLSKLYESLGELASLESGVSSLNRTLANVKTTGIYGEAQLENILSDILPRTLYDTNVVTKRSVPGCQDRVEFAIRIPDKESTGSFLYLPVDSKFPVTILARIRSACDQADPEGLQKARRDLEQRIRTDAQSMSAKYIDPPATTDFAVMFLPAESLYSEVLGISGLDEECRRKYHVIISGPSTFSALVSSLNVGFRYMAVNRDSLNILKLLSAIKTQYAKLSELIETADSRLELARKATSELQHRTDLINRRLSSVDDLDPEEARGLLGISDSPAVRFEDNAAVSGNDK